MRTFRQNDLGEAQQEEAVDFCQYTCFYFVALERFMLCKL